MPIKRFTDEQIAFALQPAEAGTTIGESCRELGIAEATTHRSKRFCGHMGIVASRRIKRLEGENEFRIARSARPTSAASQAWE